jgi:hypothetical protein
MATLSHLDYIREAFWAEVRTVNPASAGQLASPPERVSVFALRPTMEEGGVLGEQRRLVEALPDPGRFVRAFYLWSLFDQVLHTLHPDVHSGFQRLYPVPKPCTILSGYWQICHPRFLLYCGAHYEGLSSDSVENEFTRSAKAAREHFLSIVLDLTPETAEIVWKGALARMSEEAKPELHLPLRMMTGRSADDPMLLQGARVYRKLCAIAQESFSA